MLGYRTIRQRSPETKTTRETIHVRVQPLDDRRRNDDRHRQSRSFPVRMTSPRIEPEITWLG